MRAPLLMLGLLLGCQDSALMELRLKGTPGSQDGDGELLGEAPGSVVLHVGYRNEGRVSSHRFTHQEVPSYPVIPVRLPPGARALRGLWVGLLDAENCVFAQGSHEELDLVDARRLFPVDVTMVRLKARACPFRSPDGRRVEPLLLPSTGSDLVGQRVPLTVRGWGFHPDSEVYLAGGKIGETEWRHPALIEAPAPPGTTGEWSLRMVVPPDTDMKTFGDVRVRYYDGRVEFVSVPLIETDPRYEDVYGLAVEDLNRDGRPDLAVLIQTRENNKGLVRVFLQEGPGLSRQADVFTGRGPSAIVAAQLRLGEPIDFLVANRLDHTVSLLRNDGEGHLVALQHAPAGQDPFALVAAELDGDEFEDVAVVNYSSNNAQVQLLHTQPDGTLAAPSLLAQVGGQSTSIAAADLNGDQRTDLAVAGVSDGNIRLLLNLEKGWSNATPLGSSSGMCSVVSGDLDGDGRADLASGGNALVLFNRHGIGLPEVFRSYPLEAPVGCVAFEGSKRWVALADVNRDRQMDVLMLTRDPLRVQIVLHEPYGLFPQTIVDQQPRHILNLPVDPVTLVALAPKRQDDRTDILVAHLRGVLLLRNESK